MHNPAGVHVRSAATLGGHFGLLAVKPLPSDLAVTLAAAGAWLQLMTVEPAELATTAAAAAEDGGGAGSSSSVGSLHQQWMSVEEYLATTCVSSSSSSRHHSARGSSVAAVVQPEDAAAAAAALYRIITAVWLPYSNDASERFWSYKIGLRHFHSHALLNMAVWTTFDAADGLSGGQQTAGSSSNSLMGILCAQAGVRFAGATVTAARVFVGLPPTPPSRVAAGGGPALSDATFSSTSSSGSSSSSAFRWQQEHWCVQRLSAVEQAVTGKPLNVQVGMHVVHAT
jgi:hypothetical protein